MSNQPSFDSAIAALAGATASADTNRVMDGVWQRAGQLSEIADRRQRLALFAGLFVVGLGAGVGTTGYPDQSMSSAPTATFDLGSSDRLSPAALLEGRP